MDFLIIVCEVLNAAKKIFEPKNIFFKSHIVKYFIAVRIEIIIIPPRKQHDLFLFENLDHVQGPRKLGLHPF